MISSLILLLFQTQDPIIGKTCLEPKFYFCGSTMTYPAPADITPVCSPGSILDQACLDAAKQGDALCEKELNIIAEYKATIRECGNDQICINNARCKAQQELQKLRVTWENTIHLASAVYGMSVLQCCVPEQEQPILPVPNLQYMLIQ